MIAVCGEALIDLVTGSRVGAAPGGGPFNTARALARLGVETCFIGHLSTDVDGRQLAERLAADGVDLSLASYGPEPTTRAVARVDEAGHAAYEFVVEGTAAPNLTAAMLPARLGDEIRALHIGSLGLVMEPIGSTLMQLALRESGRRLIMLDPNIRTAVLGSGDSHRRRIDSLMSISTIVKVSDSDVEWLFPGLGHEAAARVIVERGARLAVVTLGEAGAFGVTAGAMARVTAPKVSVVDTIGAGDAFGAALLAWLHESKKLSVGFNLSDRELTSALEFACEVASLTCTRAGADPPDYEEIRRSTRR